MPKIYNCTLYFNTGFDRGNIPDSPQLLTAFANRDYDAVFLWQDRYNAAIRIKAEWDDVKNADYAKVGDSCYVVNGVEMKSPLTAEISLTMDNLNTAGGIDNIQLEGWVERAHVASDDLYANVIPEPWSPSGELIIRSQQLINYYPNTAQKLEVVVTNCDLSKAQEYEALVATAAEDPTKVCVFPKLPEKEGLSTVTAFPTDGERDTNRAAVLPHMYYYRVSELTQPDISALRSCGIESAIVNAFVLPVTELNQTQLVEDEYGYISQIVGDYKDLQLDLIKLEYAAPKNKKAIAIYNDITIQSIVSDSKNTFKSSDVYDGETDRVSVTLRSDPMPNGTTYCQPKYYKGQESKALENSVSGLPWLTAGLLYSEASGGTLTTANAARQNRLDEYNYNYSSQVFFTQAENRDENRAYNYVSDFTSALGNAVSDTLTGSPVKALTGAISSGTSIGNNARLEAQNWDLKQLAHQKEQNDLRLRMGQRNFEAAMSVGNVAPTFAFPVSLNMSSYYGNAFLIYQVSLSDNDLARFDDFLSMYGYAVDKVAEQSDLNNRKNHNYIKMKDAYVKTPHIPLNMRQGIEDMLNLGVRIWHTPPSREALLNNPIKED